MLSIAKNLMHRISRVVQPAIVERIFRRCWHTHCLGVPRTRGYPFVKFTGSLNQQVKLSTNAVGKRTSKACLKCTHENSSDLALI
jgi:hypothetical protein